MSNRIWVRFLAIAAALACSTAPVSAQSAQQAPIYSFPTEAEGTLPWGNVIMSTDGALYGIASRGGSTNCNQGCGLVFKLTPPDVVGGAWTRTTIYAFTGGTDGGRCSRPSSPTRRARSTARRSSTAGAAAARSSS